jgi:DNA polymerase-3 subunit gamma/tau
MWQMLLKALEEVRLAPNAMMAAEMAIIRLTHVAELPTPGDLVKKLTEAPPSSPFGRSASSGAPSSAPVARAPAPPMSTGPSTASGAQTALQRAPGPDLARYPTWDSVVALVEETRDIKLLVEVKSCLRLVSYVPGRIELEPTENAPRDLINRLKRMLQEATGVTWVLSVGTGGAPTITEAEDIAKAELTAEVEKHPLMQAIRDAFPEARIEQIRTRADLTRAAQAEALPEMPDEDDTPEDWDPFED